MKKSSFVIEITPKDGYTVESVNILLEQCKAFMNLEIGTIFLDNEEKTIIATFV